MQVPSLGREGPLKKEMATHSSILAWKIPQTEEPGGLPSMGLQSQMRLSDRVKYIYIYIHIYIICAIYVKYIVYVHPSPRSTLGRVYHLEKVPDTL